MKFHDDSVRLFAIYKFLLKVDDMLYDFIESVSDSCMFDDVDVDEFIRQMIDFKERIDEIYEKTYEEVERP